MTGDGEAALGIAAAVSGHARGVSWAPQGCLRAAVIVAVAVAGALVGRVVGGLVLSGGGGGERFELVEGSQQLLGPRPVVLQAQLRATAVKREPAGDVQQPVAMPTSAWLP